MKIAGVRTATLKIAKGELTIVSTKAVTERELVSAIAKTKFKLKTMSKPTPVARP